jgi:uncharacterized protein
MANDNVDDRHEGGGGPADFAIGGLAGLGGGLLGVGGGFVMVPLQVLWTRTSQRLAAGTSLAAIVPIAAAGAFVYYFGKGTPQLDLKVSLFVMVGSTLGAIAGANLARIAPESALRMLVAVLLFGAAAKELYDAAVGASTAISSAGPQDLDAGRYALISLCGFGIGIVSGLAGVGGGILIVPTLVVGFGIAQRLAQGTSLLATIPTALMGAIIHWRQGNVDVGAAARMSLAGVPAVVVGAVLALWLPGRVLAGLFGGVLGVLAFRLWPRSPGAAQT